MSRVTILGSGAWGTALGMHLARRGHPVCLWTISQQEADTLNRDGENRAHHPGIPFPDGLRAVADLAVCCRDADALVVATPSHAVREVAKRALPHLDHRPLVCTVAKGIEEGTSMTMSAILEEVLGDELRHRVCALSGPSFAREVARGMPTAVTAAARSREVAEELQHLFNGPTFRVYASTDIVGVEVGGAVKNVIAVAAGVSDGLGFGHNSRAALITRGLAEITRLGIRLGADRRTLYGLSCLGDLILTCTGDLSRNRTVGLALGRGEKLEQVLAGMNEVAEGVRNTRSVAALAAGLGVEMPITEQMRLVLYEAKDPRQAVVDLMSRPPRHEAE